jgi:hypothetical protein
MLRKASEEGAYAALLRRAFNTDFGLLAGVAITWDEMDALEWATVKIIRQERAAVESARTQQSPTEQ